MLVEGLEMRAQRVPKWMLESAWKTLSTKPFPNVKAWRLSDDNFNRVLEHRQCLEDNLREMEEWGRVLSTHGTDACVFNGEKSDNADYVILIRKKPYHTLQEIIEHELAHIARGDL